LRYEIPRPNAAQRAIWQVSSSRPGAWLFAKSLPRIDKGLLGLSRGQLTVPGLLAGIPVLTLTTTGARTGLRRTSPLLGVPAGDDIAVISTRFGQHGTPGWYYNLRRSPCRDHVPEYQCQRGRARGRRRGVAGHLAVRQEDLLRL
jgi:deazaflavin-dependent oxidoreductase (nitroreductase family)